MHGELPARILLMTLFSWVYLFMLGVVLQLNQAFVLKFLRGKAGWWLIAYLAWAACLSKLGLPVEGNDATPLSTLPLGLLVISLAFTATGLSAKLLRGNDFSYGLYIYHMLVINVFVESGWTESSHYLMAAIAASLLLAVLSWKLVEKPALQLKRESQFPRAAG
jgi:peptidoglycan/LPS O-acetylase OafA/YrhL